MSHHDLLGVAIGSHHTADEAAAGPGIIASTDSGPSAAALPAGDDVNQLSGQQQAAGIEHGFEGGDSHHALGDRDANDMPVLPVLGGLGEHERFQLLISEDRVALIWSRFLNHVNMRRVAGGLWACDPPTLSRVYQVLSDGMLGFRQARKIEGGRTRRELSLALLSTHCHVLD